MNEYEWMNEWRNEWITCVGSNNNNYKYDDITPVAGFNYYRLKEVSFNGEYKYTNVIMTANNRSVALSNIKARVVNTNGSFTINIEAASDTQGLIEIIDIQGRKVYEQTIDLHEGVNELACNTNELLHGVYLVNFNNQLTNNVVSRFVY